MLESKRSCVCVCVWERENKRLASGLFVEKVRKKSLKCLFLNRCDEADGFEGKQTSSYKLNDVYYCWNKTKVHS